MKKKRRKKSAWWASQKSLIVAVVALFAFVVIWTLIRDDNATIDYTPVDSFNDIHGLVVDPIDSKYLYIATHRGLIRATDDTTLELVGSYRADFMGFALDPVNGIMFASGHHVNGGNIGVIRSDNLGLKWETIAMRGQTDFHALAISPKNPQILYGWFNNRLYKSEDNGKNWNTMSASNLTGVISLSPDPINEQVLWAATQKGLSRSFDGGQSFALEKFPNETITALVIDSVQPNTMYLWVMEKGLFRSQDGGIGWQNLETNFDLSNRDSIGFIAVDPSDSQTIYAATFSTKTYKTSDSGARWHLVINGRP